MKRWLLSILCVALLVSVAFAGDAEDDEAEARRRVLEEDNREVEQGGDNTGANEEIRNEGDTNNEVNVGDTEGNQEGNAENEGQQDQQEGGQQEGGQQEGAADGEPEPRIDENNEQQEQQQEQADKEGDGQLDNAETERRGGRDEQDTELFEDNRRQRGFEENRPRNPIKIDTTRSQPEIDRQVLEAVYELTGGSEWTSAEGWLEKDSSICGWYGVTCGSNKTVEKLYLFDNGLLGGIPTELGLLADLKQLHLGMNGLTGSIPTELGKLRPDVIELELNCLQGEVPLEVFALTQAPHEALVDVDFNEKVKCLHMKGLNFECNGFENTGINCTIADEP